jgi:hypothetical protein
MAWTFKPKNVAELIKKKNSIKNILLAEMFF